MKQSACLFLIFACVLIFFGCSDAMQNTNAFFQDANANQYSSGDFTFEKELFASEETTDYTMTYRKNDVYNVMDIKAKELFDTVYKDNSIDSYINEKFNNAVSTLELSNIANEYVLLWKAEMNHAISKYKESLDEEGVISFTEAQSSWEQFVKSNLKWHTESLFIEGPASELSYKIPINLACLYKNRTFEIKYFHYILNGQSSDLSLIFDEKQQ